MALYDAFLGNQYEARLGPSQLPLVITTALAVAEPLLLVGVILSNRTGAGISVTVHVVASGASAGDGTKLLGEVNAPPNDLIAYNFSGVEIPLNTGDTLQHLAGGAGVNITYVISRRNR